MDILVSVIIPIYKGKEFIPRLLYQCMKAFEKANIIDISEIIIVNDCPEESIFLPEIKCKICLLNNDANKGIHYSRARGLSASKGKFIHFLDQDDLISSDFYEYHLRNIKSADVSVANCRLELSGSKRDYKYLYNNALEYLNVRIPLTYILFDNRIFSPGQCLIRKDSIPKHWMKHILIQNGADDYYLWLLMFEEHARFATCKRILFLHKYTDRNYSLDKYKMENSLKNVRDYYALNSSKRYFYLYDSKIRYMSGENGGVSFLFRWLKIIRDFRIKIRKIKTYG